MKTSIKKNEGRTGFTIVELLTVMSIIVILISLLVPSLNKVKRYAKKVKQKAQFHSIDVAMELYATEFDGYPNSDAQDEVPTAYNGALKLAEAMMGQDLLGFHPDSYFRSDGTTDGTMTAATDLYPVANTYGIPEYEANLKARRGPYLQLDNANAFKLKHLYGVGNTGDLDGERFVLCDVYARVRVKDDPGDDTDNNIKGKIGMPILYFKANLSATKHDYTKITATAPYTTENIYNVMDNVDVIGLDMPWQVGPTHDIEDDPILADWERFYVDTKNDKISTTDMPYNSDSYILISAGFDGEYGTSDDVFNFVD